jgi:hypothetical protein
LVNLSFCIAFSFSFAPTILIVGRHFLSFSFAPRAFRQLNTVHSRILLSFFRTLPFGLELSRSASNSHVRPRTPTFGLELPRSASNSHVRLCLLSDTFRSDFTCFSQLTIVWTVPRPRLYCVTVLTYSCVLSCHHLMSSRMRVSFLRTWLK